MSAPKLLDLFCGAGGCSVGYSRAGFDVFGVDIAPHADYPFPMVDRDALEVLDHLLSGGGLFFNGVYGKSPDGRRLFTRKDGSVQRAARGLAEGAAAMGIDWMTAWEDVTEAIPPAYTEHLGGQLLAHLSSQEIAS